MSVKKTIREKEHACMYLRDYKEENLVQEHTNSFASVPDTYISWIKALPCTHSMTVIATLSVLVLITWKIFVVNYCSNYVVVMVAAGDWQYTLY